jgi:hypothetical protein
VEMSSKGNVLLFKKADAEEEAVFTITAHDE